ncbi:DUF1428 domain-containing protein [Pendulispora rubella]|uniref:DUF1428 domain-containing protein n=1 Tax=Pendulispora rubella TaxID=2741070 RepID=A0ABZ2LIJ6_9BACT
MIAVPTGNKVKFIEQPRKCDSVFLEYGATRLLEWGDDVPDGKVADLRRAVRVKEDETVVFSWIKWPDKTTRDTGMARVMQDPRLSPENKPIPFDGKPLIFGRFAPIVELKARRASIQPGVHHE